MKKLGEVTLKKGYRVSEEDTMSSECISYVVPRDTKLIVVTKGFFKKQKFVKIKPCLIPTYNLFSGYVDYNFLVKYNYIDNDFPD